MSRRPSILRLYLLDDRRRIDLDRASVIVDRLAARRRLEGAPPEWRMAYDTEDRSLAMRMCARDLTDIDPRWLEIFDFKILPLARHYRAA